MSMKILATSDWHLGNLFHGNDRLPEHKHFLKWLLEQIAGQKPDALLIAGDIFDNGNPSAAAQTVYYEFLADATQLCPNMQVIITAGNHDSASRLEAPRPLLTRYHVEIRGNVRKIWKQGESGDDDKTGGQEEVDLEGWNDHPDYMTCGHIHKRQHIWNTDWARYTGSILPMSFAEKDYTHGIDLITIGCDKGEKEEMEAKEEEEEGMKEEEEKEKENCKGKSKEWKVDFLEYKPQHALRILPEDEEELTFKKWQKLINSELSERTDGELSDHFDYVMLKVKQEKLTSDDIKELEKLVNEKDAVLCKIQRIIPQLDLSTIQGSQHITSIEDIINRPPLDTLKEAFAIRHNAPMNERQEKMLSDLLTTSSL